MESAATKLFDVSDATKTFMLIFWHQCFSFMRHLP